jgi:hypothetical protein
VFASAGLLRTSQGAAKATASSATNDQPSKTPDADAANSARVMSQAKVRDLYV